MASGRLHLAWCAKALTTIAAASLLLLSCAESQQTYSPESSGSVVITGSLTRGGASQYPEPGVSLRHPGALPAPAPPPPPGFYWQPQNTEKYPNATPNPVKVTANDPVSTFSVDV